MVRPLAMALLVGAALYLALCAYLYLRQREMMYFPAYTRVPRDRTDYALPRPDAVLRGWVLNPGQRRAIVYFGGNGEAVEHNADDFRAWFPQYTVYLLAYRGYGASDGSPSEAALLDDALALYDDVASRHGEVAAIGRSLGSAVATHVAAQRPLARLALITPFDSIARVAQSAFPIIPVSLLLHDRYEAAAWATSVRCPVLVLVAARDEVIPLARSEAQIASFPTAPLQQRIAGAGHNDIQDFAPFGESLRRFFTH